MYSQTKASCLYSSPPRVLSTFTDKVQIALDLEGEDYRETWVGFLIFFLPRTIHFFPIFPSKFKLMYYNMYIFHSTT